MYRKNLFSKRSLFFALICGLILSAVISVYAEVPHLINYQGRLLQGGLPVTGVKSITFKIWTAESGGTSLWQETQTSVSVTNGIFNVLLGNVTSLPTSVFETATAYLETIVENTSLGRQMER